MVYVTVAFGLESAMRRALEALTFTPELPRGVDLGGRVACAVDRWESDWAHLRCPAWCGSQKS
jgi:hypothetical protein